MPPSLTVKPRSGSCAGRHRPGAGRHDDVLVEDRVADHRSRPDHRAVEKHGVHHLGPPWTRTPGDRTEWSTIPPAMIAPIDRIDSVDVPPCDELGAGVLRQAGVDRPLAVVEVEDRVDRDEVHVGLVVGVEGPDIAPVAAVAVGRARHLVVGEVVDAGVALVGQHRDDAAAHVVDASPRRRRPCERVEQRVGREDVVAHRHERLVRASRAARAGRPASPGTPGSCAVGVRSR